MRPHCGVAGAAPAATDKEHRSLGFAHQQRRPALPGLRQCGRARAVAARFEPLSRLPRRWRPPRVGTPVGKRTSSSGAAARCAVGIDSAPVSARGYRCARRASRCRGSGSIRSSAGDHAPAATRPGPAWRGQRVSGRVLVGVALVLGVFWLAVTALIRAVRVDGRTRTQLTAGAAALCRRRTQQRGEQGGTSEPGAAVTPGSAEDWSRARTARDS